MRLAIIPTTGRLIWAELQCGVVRNTFRMFGEDRVCIISDSMRAAGMDSGVYSLDRQKVFVRGRRATLADGTIAGSTLNLMETLRITVKEMHVLLETAVRPATINPAKSIGIHDRFGTISSGKCANLILMDSDLKIVDVFVRGKLYI